MFSSLQNENVRDNDDIQSLRYRWDSSTVLNATVSDQGASLPQISNGKSKVVNFRPFCGLFNQSKLLPFKYMGNLILEFELGDVNDAIITPFAYGAPYNIADSPFSVGKLSDQWSIQNCKVICDICILDNALK